jgi:hypothetical protein
MLWPQVPPDHRLVVQRVGGSLISTSDNPGVLEVLFGTGTNGGEIGFHVPNVSAGGNLARSAFDESVLLYFDAGAFPVVDVYAPAVNATLLILY